MLRIKRLETEGFTLDGIIKFRIEGNRLGNGLRTMALKNLSSDALSNEREGYYSAVEYSPGRDKCIS
jgi:hypothetical protein